MAKMKVHPRPGALSELLKRKGMTQMDAAFEKRCADRKTLLRIDRGEEVKLETLQKVADKLQVTAEYFLHPPAAEVTNDSDVLSSLLEPGTVMLRKLDGARLEELLLGAERLEWQLNVQVRDDEARKFLEDLETAVEKFWGDLRRFRSFSRETLSLRIQLDRLKTADDIVARLERLAEHHLALLGAGYLFWECSIEAGKYEYSEWSKLEYRSSNIVLLSVEPFGTQSRRADIFKGEPPPLFAPDLETAVFVNGVKIPAEEEL